MTTETEKQNIQTVRDAFDALFNKRDIAAFERYWSPDYIQHSAHIPPGRDGLRNLVSSFPDTLRYESGVAVANDDVVMIHGRFSGFKEVAWIAVDIVRIKDGILLEHWDVLQDEVDATTSQSGAPMFGDVFPVHAAIPTLSGEAAGSEYESG